jgi:uncharacterized protein YqjF (DUF2071 family)
MTEKLVKPRLMVFGYLLLATVVSISGHPKLPGESARSQFETRCGWFINPTPANIWLYDRYGEWTIGVQGGYQVEAEWGWPKFTSRQWVRTNGNYGYGCACLQLRVNRETHEVLEIKSARARPLAVCRQDRSLKKWKDRLE